MHKIRCVIVEDEIPAAEELKFLISRNENFVVEAMANNGEEGYETVMEMKSGERRGYHYIPDGLQRPCRRSL